MELLGLTAEADVESSVVVLEEAGNAEVEAEVEEVVVVVEGMTEGERSNWKSGSISVELGGRCEKNWKKEGGDGGTYRHYTRNGGW